MEFANQIVLAGYRSQIREVLERKNIPYVIWSPKPVRNQGKALHCLVDRFTTDRGKIELIAEQISSFGQFSHVIAGTEESVPAASLLRRALGARKSKHSVAKSCHDKLIMKNKLHDLGVPMTPYLNLRDEKLTDKIIFEELGSPVVVKKRTQSGGSGIQMVDNLESLHPFHGKSLIAEKFVKAEEASIESFIQNGKVLFENITQYKVPGEVNFVPSHFSTKIKRELLSLNKKVIEGLGIQWGVTHLETYLTPKGPIFGEIAMRPPGGHIMDLISKAYEFDAWEAFVDIELGKNVDFPEEIKNHCGVWIFHPGAGVIKKIEGFEAMKSDPNVLKLKLKVKKGQSVKPRTSVGKDVGYVQFYAKSPKELEGFYNRIKNRLRIALEPRPNHPS